MHIAEIIRGVLPWIGIAFLLGFIYGESHPKFVRVDMHLPSTIILEQHSEQEPSTPSTDEKGTRSNGRDSGTSAMHSLRRYGQQRRVSLH